MPELVSFELIGTIVRQFMTAQMAALVSLIVVMHLLNNMIDKMINDQKAKHREAKRVIATEQRHYTSGRNRLNRKRFKELESTEKRRNPDRLHYKDSFEPSFASEILDDDSGLDDEWDYIDSKDSKWKYA